MSTQREVAKREWKGRGTIESINAGSLQRIADATELMAKNHADLVRWHDMYKNWYVREKKRCEKLARSNAALRGVITRLRNKEAQFS